MFIKDFEQPLEQMKRLCTDLLALPSYQELKHQLEQFLADEAAIEQYNQFLDLQSEHERKQVYRTLTSAELAHFEQIELAIYGNMTIRKYLYAQRELDNLIKIATQMLSKTIELGRLPAANELDKPKRGCGSHG